MESSTKNSSLFNQPLPLSDSDQSILLDLFGVGRTITLDGIFTGTLTEQNTFIEAIESLQGGNQTGYTFVSSHTSVSSKTVFVQNFTWTVNKADVSKINYNLSLMEGATVS